MAIGNYNFDTFANLLPREMQAAVLGNKEWRERHEERLEEMFDIREICSDDKTVSVREYRIADKETILDFFLLFISGFTASNDVREKVDVFYAEHQKEINEVMRPIWELHDGDYRPLYIDVFFLHSALYLLTPARGFYSLVLYGMYLLGVDMYEFLKDAIDDYGIVLLEEIFHTDMPRNFSMLDTSRFCQQRPICIETITTILRWLRGDEDDWLCSICIEPILEELWENDLPFLEEMADEIKEFDVDEELKAYREEHDFKPDVMSQYMSGVLKLPNASDYYCDFTTPAMDYWVAGKIKKGFQPHFDNKMTNFMYCASWLSYLSSLLVISLSEFVEAQIQTSREIQKEIVKQEVRSEADVLKISNLEKQLKERQEIINQHETKHLREMQALENKISALEEEVQYFKEQQECSEQLHELEDAVDVSISYEDMVKELQNYNIVIMGGHENWQTRVKRDLPRAKFTSRKMGDTPQVSSSVDAVFFKFDQASHKVYFKMKSMCKSSGVPFYYISGTEYKNCVKQIYMQLQSKE